jgi:transposase-like protein
MRSIPAISDICNILFNEDKCLTFLYENEFLNIDSLCNSCGGNMILEGIRIRCSHYSCKKSKSIFSDTFFANNKLKCNEILHLGYLWLTECKTKTILRHTKHNPTTILNYLNRFRQIVATMLQTDDTLIGGRNVIIQVDETKMGKRKYHRGHHVEGAWVIVGVELTNERKMFAEVVNDRSEATIVSVLSRHVAAESIIWTDCWRGYRNLSRIFGIQHQTVNHSQYFTDPETNVNTNTVEGTNFALKNAVPRRNRTRNNLQMHLSEFIWRRKHDDALWNSFLNALKEINN